MGRAVIWTIEALESYQRVIDHLRSVWTAREVAKFIRAVESTEKTIALFPKGFRRSSDGR